MNPVIIGNATLYLGDCLEILPTLPKVDAVITDPPYGIGFKHSGKHPNGAPPSMAAAARGNDLVTGDCAEFDPSPLVDLAPIVMMWGANHFAHRLPPGHWHAWDKLDGMESWDSFSDVEFCWQKGKGASRMFRRKWKAIACVKHGEDNGLRQHVTQKPVGLMAWCITQAHIPVGTVLDPYMGSGTTGVATTQAKLKFIGIEIEPKYFDIACERIENAQRQARMFA